MYKDKKVILATQHRKEEAIREPFESQLGCQICLPQKYDTDQFGTFTGEIPRKLSAYETLIAKAKLAAQEFGYDYAIANEGCFGPHPNLYFVPADTEMMAFIDFEQDLIIAELEITTDTNFHHIDIRKTDPYDDFLKKVDFPSHGVIVRTIESPHSYLEKGITAWPTLQLALKTAFTYSDQIRIETDMRAMMNPTRMKVIEALAIKLVRRIQQLCPKCNTPGFGKVSYEGHLKCSLCGAFTELYAKKVKSCLKCDYKTDHLRDDGFETADPQYCPYCNP